MGVELNREYSSQISVESIEQDIRLLFERSLWMNSVQHDFSFDPYGAQWIGKADRGPDDPERSFIIRYTHAQVLQAEYPQIVTGI